VSNADIADVPRQGAGPQPLLLLHRRHEQLSQERLSLEAGLRHALDADEIEVFYQPKIDFRHGRVTGVEALIRWRHPQLGLLSPDRFVPLAEETATSSRSATGRCAGVRARASAGSRGHPAQSR
jgi:predicted signal transduction protein with EAL and GGDEF domain